MANKKEQVTPRELLFCQGQPFTPIGDQLQIWKTNHEWNVKTPCMQNTVNSAMHSKVSLNSVTDLNSHALGFHPQTQKLAPRGTA